MTAPAGGVPVDPPEPGAAFAEARAAIRLGTVGSAEVEGPDPLMALLYYDDGEVRFLHQCFDGAGRRLIAAPALASHTVTGDPPTVTPSVDCPGCPLHGWVRDGRWVDA